MKAAEKKSVGDVAETAKALLAQHAEYADVPIITIEEAGTFLDQVLGVLFPHLAPQEIKDQAAMEGLLEDLREDLATFLDRACSGKAKDCTDKAADYIERLPEIAAAIRLDAEALLEGDPAAHSLEEILMAYPGVYAVAAYRIAHPIYAWGIPLFPRVISEYAHRMTGIDINPGAEIGKSLYIDHGTAIVIGETAVIGDQVKIYQGVTLGALSVAQADKTIKRHPTIEDHVVIYANATILGGKTVVGHDSIIGGNVWLTRSVMPFSRVMYRSTDVSKSGMDWSI